MSSRIELQHEVEQFLYDEAAMLDERRYLDWLALFADDVRYVMPIRSLRYQADARRELSGANDLKHFDDDKFHLSLRVNRLMTGFAWADEPRSRSRHLIGNVRIDHTATTDAVVRVRSAFIVHHGRGEHESFVFTGTRTDDLRRSDGTFRIARREILLDATVLPTNLGVFL